MIIIIINNNNKNNNNDKKEYKVNEVKEMENEWKQKRMHEQYVREKEGIDWDST